MIKVPLKQQKANHSIYKKKKGKRINKEENLAKERSVEFKKVNP
jgi:hypothetical protein